MYRLEPETLEEKLLQSYAQEDVDRMLQEEARRWERLNDPTYWPGPEDEFNDWFSGLPWQEPEPGPDTEFAIIP